jgi:malate synthase
LYGTVAISGDGGGTHVGSYNPIRGEKVVSFARDFLNQAAPLKQLFHKEAVKYVINERN